MRLRRKNNSGAFAEGGPVPSQPPQQPKPVKKEPSKSVVDKAIEWWQGGAPSRYPPPPKEQGGQ